MAFDPLATPGISLEWQGAPERWKDASTLGAYLLGASRRIGPILSRPKALRKKALPGLRLLSARL